jgi:hypothetical protein
MGRVRERPLLLQKPEGGILIPALASSLIAVKEQQNLL